MSVQDALAIGIVIVGAISLFIFLVWVSIEILEAASDNGYPAIIRVLIRFGLMIAWMLLVALVAYFGSQPMPAR